MPVRIDQEMLWFSWQFPAEAVMVLGFLIKIKDEPVSGCTGFTRIEF